MTTSAPDEPPAKWTDEHTEQLIGTLLRAGVLIAAGVTAVGGLSMLLQHGGATADYRGFRGEPPELTGFRGVLSGVTHLDSLAVVQLGLILLIATPVARVILSLVAFALERDRMYVAITAIVLAVLLFSLVFGGRL